MTVPELRTELVTSSFFKNWNWSPVLFSRTGIDHQFFFPELDQFSEKELGKRTGHMTSSQKKNCPCSQNRAKIDDFIAVYGPINCALNRDKII
jgi:hypothetical protein